jgi:SpoVK/Ycf46/Vps4 family AAA+-type ATPase
VEVKKKLADYCEGARQDGADEEETKLRSALSKTIVTEKPYVKWEDVGGLEKAKELLKRRVISPIKYPQFFVGVEPMKGILLYGPPGTGEYSSSELRLICCVNFLSQRRICRENLFG